MHKCVSVCVVRTACGVSACLACDVCPQVGCVYGVSHSSIGCSWPGQGKLCLGWGGGMRARGGVCVCSCVLQNLLAAEYKYLYRYLP